MKTLKLRFSGDMCPNCANIIESKIAALGGISEAKISVMSGLIKIKHEDNLADFVKEETARIIAEVEPTACLIL